MRVDRQANTRHHRPVPDARLDGRRVPQDGRELTEMSG